MTMFGIVADVHGNLTALEAVLADLDQRGVTDVFCLGDLVGYCAEPNECVAVARQRRFRCIAGNHELIALGELGFDRCGLRPAHALRRTRETLTAESRRFLAAMPLSLTLARQLVFIHGTLRDVGEYMSNAERVLAAHRDLADRHPGACVCFFGHTHVARSYEVSGGQAVERAAFGTQALHGASTWFVNPGSVDGSRAPATVARYAIFDDATRSVFFRAARYDHDRAERKARKEGYRLPRSTLAWHASTSFARSLAARVSR